LWEDAGTFDSLLRVSNVMAKKSPHPWPLHFLYLGY
jgi:hypothetical protein